MLLMIVTAHNNLISWSSSQPLSYISCSWAPDVCSKQGGVTAWIDTCICMRVLGLLSRQRLIVSARAAFLMGSKAMR